MESDIPDESSRNDTSSSTNPFTDNPYAAPISDITAVPNATANGEEAVRNHYLKHEASVKSIGLLYFIPAGLLCLVGITQRNPSLFVNVLFLVGSAILFAIGIGIRKLQPWCVIPIGLTSGFGLFVVPIGTIINGYILWLVFSAKGRYVLSPEYKQVIEATPYIKYKTSYFVVGFIIVTLTALAFGILTVVFGNRSFQPIPQP